MGDINLDLVEIDYHVIICHSNMVKHRGYPKLKDMMDNSKSILDSYGRASLVDEE